MERGGTIALVEGDITRLSVDVIVNAANNHLWMGGGVAGAIKRAGGEAIEREAVEKGPIEVGEAVATGAGRLPAKYVVHAAVMGQDLQTDAEKVGRATRSALRVAEELGAKTVAFPALGTGVGRLAMDVCAKVMVRAVRDHLAGDSRLERVVFALMGEGATEAFARELAG